MTEWTTIRVRRDAKEAAEQRKPEGMTWSEFVAGEEYDPEIAIPPGIVEACDATEEQLAEIRELVEQMPRDTADEVEGRLR